jgi:hypothetical protein
MKRVLFAVVPVLVVLVAGSAVAARSTGSTRGVVVGRQHGVLLVASSRGLVRTVSGRARVGERVLIRNGRVVGAVGRAHRAVIRGVVVRHSGRLTFLSASRHLLVVHTNRTTASAANTAPTPGTVVQQTVSFDDQGNLDDEGEQDVGQTGQTQIQAQISAVGRGAVTVTVNGQSLVPAGLTLPSSLVGTQVTLNLSFAGGQATAEDDQGGNSQGDDQGDQGDQNDQGDDDQSSTTTTTTTTTGGDEGGD